MPSPLLSTAEFERDYQRYLGGWLQTGAPSDDSYLERVSDGITSLYSQLDIQDFQFIACTGPLQLTILPAIVDLLLKLGEARTSHFKFERLVGEPSDVRAHWLKVWQDALEQIGLLPILLTSQVASTSPWRDPTAWHRSIRAAVLQNRDGASR